MKFSKDTVNILKNFSMINPSIAFKKGNALATMSPQKSIMARATLDDTFPSDGAIYDLSRFLGVVSLFETPTYNFKEDVLEISDAGKSVSYTFADPSMIVTPTKESIEIPDPDLDIQIKWDQMNAVQRAANIMQLPEIAISGRDNITLEAINSNDPTSDRYTQTLGSNDTDHTFSFIFKAENMKLMAFDYLCKITSKGISQFTSCNEQGPKITYWIAVESNSQFS